MLEAAIVADSGLVRAWKVDRHGNLVYRDSARNFNPLAAMCGRVTLAEVQHLVEPGELDPHQVRTPGVFVQPVVALTSEQADDKRIEKRTVRPQPSPVEPVSGCVGGSGDVGGVSSGRLRSPAGACEGVEVLAVGFGERVEVLLGGLDLGVPHPLHHGPQVGSFGEQPGGVCVAEVVHAQGEVDATGFDGGQPDAGAEGIAGDWRACAVVNSGWSRPMPRVWMWSDTAWSQSSSTPNVLGSLSLG